MPRTSSSRWLAEAVGALFAVAAGAPSVRAQDTLATPPYSHAVSTWIALIATPGYERLATDRILGATSGWTRDDTGNLVKHTGSGSPKRVVACGIDETGYVVSDVTDDGYLRVHGIGNGKHPALWDQYHEGQRVIVIAVDRTNPLRSHNVSGVFAVRSNHLWRRRTADDEPTSIENLWLDVGARSRAEVAKMGIDRLDPVVRDWPEWSFSDFVAGPAASNRAGCAAVVAAAAQGGSRAAARPCSSSPRRSRSRGPDSRRRSAASAGWTRCSSWMESLGECSRRRASCARRGRRSPD